MHHWKNCDTTASIVADPKEKHANVVFGGNHHINSHLNLKWRFEHLKDLYLTSNIDVNARVKLGITTHLNLTEEGIRNIKGKNSFNLPVGLSVQFNS